MPWSTRVKSISRSGGASCRLFAGKRTFEIHSGISALCVDASGRHQPRVQRRASDRKLVFKPMLYLSFRSKLRFHRRGPSNAQAAPTAFGFIPPVWALILFRREGTEVNPTSLANRTSWSPPARTVWAWHLVAPLPLDGSINHPQVGASGDISQSSDALLVIRG